MSVSKDIPLLHDLNAKRFKSFVVVKEKEYYFFFWVITLQGREGILAMINGTLN